MTNLHVKRVYEPVGDDGYRVLVDRLWPRGVAKEVAAIDLWAKQLTPSTELRQWWHQDREPRYAEFQERFRSELDALVAPELIQDLGSHELVSLITATREPGHSHVPVLVSWLEEQGFTPPPTA